MRFYGLALVTSAIVLGACAGGDKGGSDTAAAPAASDTNAASGSQMAMAPITGTTHEVKMVLDGNTYKFDPAAITIKQGDGVKFTMVSGAPHNVAFDAAAIPADVKPQLVANMPNQISELSSPMMMNANESYTISFANIKAGKYDYVCTPHLAMGMKGSITVQ